MTEEKAGKNHRKRSRRDRFDKILTIILSFSLLLGSAGCGQAGKTGQETASTEKQQAVGTADSSYSHLRVSILVPVDAQPDLDQVEDVLNEVTRRLSVAVSQQTHILFPFPSEISADLL